MSKNTIINTNAIMTIVNLYLIKRKKMYVKMAMHSVESDRLCETFLMLLFYMYSLAYTCALVNFGQRHEIN